MQPPPETGQAPSVTAGAKGAGNVDGFCHLRIPDMRRMAGPANLDFAIVSDIFELAVGLGEKSYPEGSGNPV
jgi:hypothetical protein